MRIHVLALAAAVGVTLFVMAPAGAQPRYPPPPPSLTVSPATIVGCGNVVLQGTSFGPNELVEVTVVTTPLPGALPGRDGAGGAAGLQLVARVVSAQPDHTVRADSDGAFSLTLGLTNIGRAVITATGTESGDSTTAVATVVPPTCYPGTPRPTEVPGTPGMPGMPATGNSSGRLLWVGGVAIGSGVVLLLSGLWWRRRRW